MIKADKHFVQNVCSSSTFLSNTHARFEFIATKSVYCKHSQTTLYMLLVPIFCTFFIYSQETTMDNLLASCAMKWATIHWLVHQWLLGLNISLTIALDWINEPSLDPYA